LGPRRAVKPESRGTHGSHNNPPARARLTRRGPPGCRRTVVSRNPLQHRFWNRFAALHRCTDIRNFNRLRKPSRSASLPSIPDAGLVRLAPTTSKIPPPSDASTHPSRWTAGPPQNIFIPHPSRTNLLFSSSGSSSTYNCIAITSRSIVGHPPPRRFSLNPEPLVYTCLSPH